MSRPASYLLPVACVAGLVTAGFLLSPAFTQGKDDMSEKEAWDKVDAAMKKGLPETAIEALEPIIARAKKAEDWDEAVRAVGLKIALEGNKQGNQPEEKIERMQAVIADAPAEMKPVLQAILAHWYWHYFQQNRWRIIQRTQTSQPPGDDLQTWSLDRVMAEIDERFQAALSAEEFLKQTPVGEWSELLVDGTMPDRYRPTLSDFVAHEALSFYTSSENALTQPEDDFEVPASSPALGTDEEFLAWEIDSDERLAKAFALYQKLLRFHADDEDRTAYLAANLDRLELADAEAFGNEKDARYVARLKAFVEANREHEIAAMALHDWASVLHAQGELVEAHEVATRGENLHPKSVGGRQCHNLIARIEQKEFQVTTERVWNVPLPTIDVRYRNIAKLHFRVVKADWLPRMQQKKRRPESLDQNDRKQLLAKDPVKAWSANLPATLDYEHDVQELDAPQGLEPGFYFLIASHEESFDATDNQVVFTDFWVSDLALVTRTRHGENELGGLVTHAVTGKPIRGATVELWQQERNGYTKAKTAETDDAGLFQFDTTHQKSHVLRVTHDGRELVSAGDYYTWHYDAQPKPDERVIFFTDRSLYRPGQTIHYKGIVIRVDQRDDTYETVENRAVTVQFVDANGEQVAEQKTRSNAFGSISGRFTAPSDRLTGQMHLRVDGEPNGAVSFRVEEYKRPKFQVEFQPPEEAPKLGEPVTMTGKATAYTGAPIDGAQVRWRVVRTVRFPIWWGWYRHWPHQQESKEIAHGTATTDTDGTFEVTFVAEPDHSVSEEGEPIFRFEVTADVTDTAGETRSAERTVSVGYNALQATMSASDWLTAKEPVTIDISTKSLDGEGRQAGGTIKIHELVPPEHVHRPPLQQRYWHHRPDEDEEPEPDLSDPKNWPLGDVVDEKPFETDDKGSAKVEFELGVGAYQAVLHTQDRFGNPVTARLPLTVIDPDADDLDLKVPFLFAAPKWELEPGEEFVAVWGSGYEDARAYVEVEHRQKVVEAFWTDANRTQVKLTHDVVEAMRGGFTVRVTMIHSNRAHVVSRHVSVPWSNKQLEVTWERFVSKLKPGQEESWTAIVTGPDADTVVAEMVAGMYDASLDQYLPHAWQQSFGVFRQDHSNLNSNFENQLKVLQRLHGHFAGDQVSVEITYDAFPNEIVGYFYGYQWFGDAGGGLGKMPRKPRAAPAPGFQRGHFGRNQRHALAAAEPEMAGEKAKRADKDFSDARRPADEQQAKQDAGGPDPGDVAARKNLAETAFFFPHLVSTDQGEVRIEFTMPEALTEWKFTAFAHDDELRSGYLQDTAVTSKDLMVQPNAPRFVRAGDQLEFTVKVINQSDLAQQGTVRLVFSDARTNDAVNELLGLTEIDQTFDVPAGQSRSYSWRMSVPDDLGVLTYRAIGTTGKLSDGEEAFLPVLPRRILVTESLTLPIRGEQTKKFDFEHLLKAGDSDTLEHQSLTVQMASNPAWYAVMALPYLMEYPHQCSEQVFNRLYANSLARTIANSDPKIQRVFEQWRATDALDSPLAKNEDLKSLLVQETPWLQEAQDDSQARRNVGILFEQNRLENELQRARRQLAEQQLDSGFWPWFPGGPQNEYITLYIVSGYGRLRHLGVEVDTSSAMKAVPALDGWITEIYEKIRENGDLDDNHMSPTIALYLYGRTFFLDEVPLNDQHREAFQYFRGQAEENWLQIANRQSQAHIALALHRLGEDETAELIARSLRQRSVTDEELGMFWRDTELHYWWYRAPIETQAMMIEVFAEVAHDAEAVRDCQVWLLKQKQTQDWKTTKATADAVYALLLQGGTDRLASDELVTVEVGETTIEPEDVEAGTGFYQHRFVGPEVKPEFGNVTVTKTDPGVAWGSLHWQYFEDLAKVPAHEGTPLTLDKTLWRKEHSQDGPVLKPVDGELAVGDELVVRLVLRTDRDMEYVHLKDQRPSGTEPADVLSHYRYRDGLAYYQSTKDTASHFFVDYLPKGTYVFEYSLWVVHRGEYQSGLASIQCMYAPEFASHSASTLLEVGAGDAAAE